MTLRFSQTTVSLDGFPSITFGERRFPAIAYTSYLPRAEFYREMEEQGLELFCFPAYLAGRGINTRSGIGPFRKGIWNDDFVYDFTDVEEDFYKILSVVPEAAVLIRLNLDVPVWWEEKYPEECCIQKDGTTIRQSFSSRKWVADVSRVLKMMIQWLNDSPYARNLAGIQVAAGGTEEWMHHYGTNFEDSGDCRRTAYRRWLEERYGRTFPDAESAEINPGVAFDREVEDTLRFHAEEVANRIGDFCKVVKEESEGRLLTGAFYGYHQYLFEPRKGHGALGKVLECPYLDYLASPNVYDRSPGLDWVPMAAVDSVRLHGKLWMAENDTRTCSTRLLKETAPEVCPSGAYESPLWLGPDKHLSKMMLRNNAARMLTYSYGGWWFDMWGGWFSDPELAAEIGRCQDLAATLPEDGGRLPLPEVCIVTDEEILFFDESFGVRANRIVSQRQVLARAGCPYAMFQRRDLAAIDRHQYRFLWLLGCKALTTEELDIITGLQKSGCGVLHTDLEQSRFLPPLDGAWKPAATFIDWESAMLRKLYGQCGVHLYLESDDIIYSGNGLLAIHATSTGSKTISLPGRYTVVDVVDESVVASELDGFSMEMPQYETRLFRLSVE